MGTYRPCRRSVCLRRLAGSTAPPASNAASSTAVSAPAAAEALTFKVAYSESEDSIYGEVINAAFDEIASKTEGRVAFDVYPNNALGSITDMLEQMRAGAPMICSMGFDNLGDVVSDFAPASFPYVFNSLYEVQALAKSDWIAGIESELVKQDIQPLCYGAIGYRPFHQHLQDRKGSRLCRPHHAHGPLLCSAGLHHRHERHPHYLYLGR